MSRLHGTCDSSAWGQTGQTGEPTQYCHDRSLRKDARNQELHTAGSFLGNKSEMYGKVDAKGHIANNIALAETT